MIYDENYFDFSLDRYDTKCIKWDNPYMELNNKNIIPLWVADMDFRIPCEVSDALIKRAEHQSYGYSYLCDCDIKAYTDYYQRHHNINILKDQSTIIPSVVSGLKLGIRTLSNIGDKVIIQTPVYGPFRLSIELNNRVPLENRLVMDESNRYSMDLEHLETLFKQGNKLIMVCNPHNPVSRFWSKEELKLLLSLAKKYDVTVISDEIHADFVYKPNKFTSMLSVAEDLNYDKVVALFAPSKSFNIAGMKFSILVTRNKSILDKIENEMQRCGVESKNIFGIYAASACYNYGDDWQKGLLSYLDNSRKILKREVENIHGVKLSPVEATYLGWLDLREHKKSTDQLMDLTKKQGVVFTPGTAFSNDLADGFLRINFACPHKQLIEGLNRLKKALK